ncbi:MAG: prepilin-type N-terminal cleavage/methylation domain-containing protein [Deferribacterota bacterium]|nr:prepilin-type N-terminal cleavage/methylation domain-containing protein [Deferribacterota bacterium]
MKKNKGFSLIELMISLLIVLILFILSVEYYKPLMKRAYNYVALSDLRNFATALEGSYIDKMGYPKALVDNLTGEWLPENVFRLIDDTIGYMPSKDVLVYYDSDGLENYIIATKHVKGDKIYIKTSMTSSIYYISEQNDNTSKVSIYPTVKLPEASFNLDDSFFLNSKIYDKM